MVNIKPITKKEEYELTDEYYCLIEAIKELTHQIKRMANKKW